MECTVHKSYDYWMCWASKYLHHSYKWWWNHRHMHNTHTIPRGKHTFPKIYMYTHTSHLQECTSYTYCYLHRINVIHIIVPKIKQGSKEFPNTLIISHPHSLTHTSMHCTYQYPHCILVHTNWLLLKWQPWILNVPVYTEQRRHVPTQGWLCFLRSFCDEDKLCTIRYTRCENTSSHQDTILNSSNSYSCLHIVLLD